jgi:hypothetical protein
LQWTNAISGDFSSTMFVITTRTARISDQGRELRRGGFVPQTPGALFLKIDSVDCIIDTTGRSRTILLLRRRSQHIRTRSLIYVSLNHSCCFNCLVVGDPFRNRFA